MGYTALQRIYRDNILTQNLRSQLASLLRKQVSHLLGWKAAIISSKASVCALKDVLGDLVESERAV